MGEPESGDVELRLDSLTRRVMDLENRVVELEDLTAGSHPHRRSTGCNR